MPTQQIFMQFLCKKTSFLDLYQFFSLFPPFSLLLENKLAGFLPDFFIGYLSFFLFILSEFLPFSLYGYFMNNMKNCFFRTILMDGPRNIRIFMLGIKDKGYYGKGKNSVRL